MHCFQVNIVLLPPIRIKGKRMNRFARLFSSLLLSVLIIVLSVGFVRIHCEHRGDLSLTQVQKIEHGHQDCERMKGCMKVTVSKLSPSQVASPITCPPVFQPVIAILPSLSSLPLPMMKLAKSEVHALAPHAPPRAYLSILRVLLL